MNYLIVYGKFENIKGLIRSRNGIRF